MTCEEIIICGCLIKINIASLLRTRAQKTKMLSCSRCECFHKLPLLFVHDVNQLKSKAINNVVSSDFRFDSSAKFWTVYFTCSSTKSDRSNGENPHEKFSMKPRPLALIMLTLHFDMLFRYIYSFDVEIKFPLTYYAWVNHSRVFLSHYGWKLLLEEFRKIVTNDE